MTQHERHIPDHYLSGWRSGPEYVMSMVLLASEETSMVRTTASASDGSSILRSFSPVL